LAIGIKNSVVLLLFLRIRCSVPVFLLSNLVQQLFPVILSHKSRQQDYSSYWQRDRWTYALVLWNANMRWLSVCWRQHGADVTAR